MDGRLYDVARQAGSEGLGTRFLVYPQVPHVAGYEKPETVWISTPPNAIRPGPQDARIYVRDPLLEKPAYEFPFLPPFAGATFPPAEAGPDGHFDHLDPGSREFLSAHVFACLRRILDIWESYLGHHIDWHFSQTYERLEVIPLIEWFNAQSGFGYMEFGIDRAADGASYPFALNFDVIGHEFGHLIMLAEMGAPGSIEPPREFFGYHESVSDVIAMLSLLHFDSVLERLLRGTRGNLLTMNELNRIAELSGDRTIRSASNDRKMSHVTNEVHDLSKPFTGALFDTLIELYHQSVVDRGLVDLPHDLSHERLFELDAEEIEAIGDRFSEAYETRQFMLKAALEDARDLLGTAIATSWRHLEPGNSTYAEAGTAIAGVFDQADEGLAAETMMENLAWREIL